MKPAILLFFCCFLAFGQSSSPAPESKAQLPAGSAGSAIQQTAQAAAQASARWLAQLLDSITARGRQYEQQQSARPNRDFSKYAAEMSAGSAIQQAAQAAAAHQEGDFGLGRGAHGRQTGPVEILNDTQGVDFGPYLQRILQDVRENWYHRIPDSARMKRGKLAIEFAITKDGKVADMRLVASSGDVALDRPAWGSITQSNPFSPLPAEFKGPYLALRFRFYYNPNPITVSISAPRSLEEVPLGGAKPITVVVTGTEAKENAVEWTVAGSGCSGSACGEMTKDFYVAPTVMPKLPWVTLTAVSKADPTAKDSVTLHIVEPPSKTASKP